MNRLTTSEVNGFRPSAENQLFVVCDTGKFSLFGNQIRIISPVIEGKVSFIGSEGLGVLLEEDLVEFPSLNTEKLLRKALYEKISDLGDFVYFAFDGIEIADFVDDLKHNVKKHFAGLKPDEN